MKISVMYGLTHFEKEIPEMNILFIIIYVTDIKTFITLRYLRIDLTYRAYLNSIVLTLRVLQI